MVKVVGWLCVLFERVCVLFERESVFSAKTGFAHGTNVELALKRVESHKRVFFEQFRLHFFAQHK